jgi:hypothetical protein
MFGMLVQFGPVDGPSYRVQVWYKDEHGADHMVWWGEGENLSKLETMAKTNTKQKIDDYLRNIRPPLKPKPRWTDPPRPKAPEAVFSEPEKARKDKGARDDMESMEDKEVRGVKVLPLRHTKKYEGTSTWSLNKKVLEEHNTSSREEGKDPVIAFIDCGTEVCRMLSYRIVGPEMTGLDNRGPYYLINLDEQDPAHLDYSFKNMKWGYQDRAVSEGV